MMKLMIFLTYLSMMLTMFVTFLSIMMLTMSVTFLSIMMLTMFVTFLSIMMLTMSVTFLLRPPSRPRFGERGECNIIFFFIIDVASGFFDRLSRTVAG